MKRIKLITTNGRLINFRISEIAVVETRHSRGETAIFVTGNNDGFIVKGPYAEVIRKIEGAENDG